MISTTGPGTSSDDSRDEAGMRESLNRMDSISLRALIHKSANQIDTGIQCYALRPEESRRIPEKTRNVLRAAIDVWEKKGYALDKEDIKYAYDNLRRGDELEKGSAYKLSAPHAPFDKSDLTAVERAIVDRRSVRRFSSKDVPDELIDKVIEAGTRAPSTFSLQGCRFIVIKRAEIGKLFVQPHAWGAPVRIVAGLDRRPYELIRSGELPINAYLDLGTAIQNMLLMAHALGLGTCFGTFIRELDAIRRELKVPDHVQIVTYFVLGWPEDYPTTVPRMELEEFVSREKWQGD